MDDRRNKLAESITLSTNTEADDPIEKGFASKADEV